MKRQPISAIARDAALALALIAAAGIMLATMLQALQIFLTEAPIVDLRL